MLLQLVFLQQTKNTTLQVFEALNECKVYIDEGGDDKPRCMDTRIAFISRESLSAPNETTVIPLFLHSVKIYFHLFNTRSAENLLLVPKHAKQNPGTALPSACAMYTKAYLAVSAVLNDFNSFKRNS